MRASTAKRLDQFLAEKRSSKGGGWAQVTPEDLKMLGEVLKHLIAEKCERDADGDFPIEYHLVNRRTTKSLNYRPLPYQLFQERRVCSPQEKLERAKEVFEVAMYNLRIAQGELNTAYDMLCLEEREAKSEDANQDG